MSFLNINLNSFIKISSTWLVALIPLILIFSSKSSILILLIISFLLFCYEYIDNNFKYTNTSHLNYKICLYIFIFIVYGLISVLWSLDYFQSFKILLFEFILPILLLISILCLSNKTISIIDLNKSVYGFIVAIIILVYELKSNMAIRSFIGLRQWHGVLAHAGITLSLISPIIFVYLYHKSKIISLLFFTSVIFSSIFNINDTMKLALIIFVFVYISYRYILNLKIFISLILILYILLQPFIWSYLGSDYLAKTILGFKQSAIHRLQIWETFSNLSLLSPIHGYGISSGHFLYKFDNIVSQIPNNLHKFVDTWHPHNNFLEIWLDLGIIGVVILILFISELFKSKWINNRGHFSSLISIISVGSCANGFWQGWWITAICFVVLMYRISDAKNDIC